MPKNTGISAAEITSLINKKFEELKASILAEFKNDIKHVVDEEKKGIGEYLEKKKRELEENVDFARSVKAVSEQVQKVLAENVKLREENKNLSSRLEDLEQYGRRLSLRIYNIPKEERENCREKVAKILRDGGVDIPDFAIDRAHRIGKIKTNDAGEESQAVIVRFISWHFRTIVYRGRKNISEYKFYLDLTKTRLSMLNDARELVKDVPGVDFVYADVNCMLRAFSNGKHILFSNLDELRVLIQGLSV